MGTRTCVSNERIIDKRKKVVSNAPTRNCTIPISVLERKRLNEEESSFVSGESFLNQHDDVIQLL